MNQTRRQRAGNWITAAEGRRISQVSVELMVRSRPPPPIEALLHRDIERSAFQMVQSGLENGSH